MGQFIFTFHSPMGIPDTISMIKNVVRYIGGKIKDERKNIIFAAWRTKSFMTVFPTKCTFYIGEDMVRAVIPAPSGFGGGIVAMERGKGSPYERVWNEFILGLNRLYPNIDFGIVPGTITLDAVKFVGDKTEQVFTSTSRSTPSLSGALVGGMLFGSTGAIIGGMNQTTVTQGRSTTRFANKLLVTVRYSNGLIFDDEIIKDSYVYNQIIVNMSKLDKE